MTVVSPDGLVRLLLWQHDVPDYMETSRHAYCGSGFLIKYFRRFFIVTARHVWWKESVNHKALFSINQTLGGGYTPLPFVDHCNINCGPGVEQAAQDISVFEIHECASAALEKVDMPAIQFWGGLEFHPKPGQALVAMGFPMRLPREQIDFETGMITPSRLDMYGTYLGPSKFPAMGMMHLPDNWVRVSGIAREFDLPANLNGMCGGLVCTDDGGPRLPVGMITMAGSNLIQFIDIELIAKLIVTWVLSRNDVKR
jgi:hypothetical protein